MNIINKKTFAICLMTVLMLTAIGTAQAATELKITDSNKDILKNGVYNSNYLNWTSSGKNLDAANKKSVTIGSIKATTLADNYGNYWGECVSMVKALSKDNTVTANWIKGNKVMDGAVTQGTAIATFLGSGGKYQGHTAIFDSYVKDNTGKITSIKVWDQNWVGYPTYHVVGKHSIGNSGTSTSLSNASNYYVVKIP